MIDKNHPGMSRDNIRSLVYLLGVELDRRLAAARRGTPYEHVRASDIRVFVFASGSHASISDVARALGISRQAVHMSAQRLKELGVISLEPVLVGKRDVVMNLTALGEAARQTADVEIQRLESDIAEVIGTDGLQTLRQTLEVVTQHLDRKHDRAF